MALLIGHGEIWANASVKMALHEGPEVVRMLRRQRLPFPIQALVHVKHMQSFQRYAVRVHKISKWLVPASRPARDNGARWPALPIVFFNRLNQLRGHQLAHRAGVRNLPVGHAQLRMTR